MPKSQDQGVHRRTNLRLHHVIVGGVEDVASNDPHDVLLHQSLVGSPGKCSFGILFPAPKGGVCRNRDGAVRS